METSFNYTDSTKDAIVSELVSFAAKSISKFFKKSSKKKQDYSFEDNLIRNHFNELLNWSKELEFIGLSGKPISTIIKTIQLEYQYSHNRKKEAVDNDEPLIKEDDFIFLNGNVIIEGDPGSGKTTTLKRLLYKHFFSDSDAVSLFNFPILVRFRSLESGSSVYTYIAALLGINYKTELEKYEVEVTKVRVEKVNGKEVEKRYKTKETRTRPIYFINEERIEGALISLLEQNSVLLIMDGLDELNPDLFESVQKEIKEIGLRLNKSKIIITSRPNYVKVSYPNFSIYQVSPLSKPQIEAISGLWLSDYDEFISELESKSYFELANRPLFLCFLILLYIENQKKLEKKLPKSSKEVYEQIIELLIAKWDKEREVFRRSKYAYFDEKNKIKFLSHLSFRLTYITKAKTFSHQQLTEAYLAICPHFSLPIDEAEEVAEEIENHTGIIIKSLYNQYEFSHLAIQEYLCALYIIGAPFNEKIEKYLVEYSPPLALAVALSTDSSLWLTELIKKVLTTINDIEARTRIVSQILSRLNIEAPFFEEKKELAVSLLTACKFCNCSNQSFSSSFEKFISENINVEYSILKLMMDYTYSGKNDAYNRFSFRKKFVHNSNSPDVLCLPKTSMIIKKIPELF